MFQLLNIRFGELTRKPDAPFLARRRRQERHRRIHRGRLARRARRGRQDSRTASKAIILEARRAREFGFSADELDRGAPRAAQLLRAGRRRARQDRERQLRAPSTSGTS